MKALDVSRISIDATKEIVSLRGEYQKAFDIGSGRIKYICTGHPIHYLKSGAWDDIDIQFAESQSAKGYMEELCLSNSMTYGYRKDLQGEKFFGMRLSVDAQIETTPIKIGISGKDFWDGTKKFTRIRSEGHNTVFHEISDSVGLYTKVSGKKVVTAVRTTEIVTEFEIIEQIHLKGFAVLNKKNETDSLCEYIPDKFNRFAFGNGDKTVYIRRPKMWDSKGSHKEGIEHTLYESEGCLYYKKVLSDDGVDSISFLSGEIFIDADYGGDEDDGWVGLGGQSSVSAALSAETGSFVNDSDAFLQVGIYTSAKPYAWLLQRGFLYFDTSAIGSSATVEAASLYITTRLDSQSTTLFSGGIHAVEGSQGKPLTVDDYSHFARTSYASQTGIDCRSTATVTEYELAFNSSGKSAVNKTGTTKICIITTSDYNNVSSPEPTKMILYFCTQDHGTSANRPYLSVTTSGGVTTGNIKKVGVAWANVKKIGGVAVANIKKVSGVSA